MKFHRAAPRLSALVALLALLGGCGPKPPAQVPEPSAAATEVTPDPATAAPNAQPAVAVTVNSDDPVVQQIVAVAQQSSQAHEYLTHLTKQIGARLTGSHNLMTAEKWARDEFAKLGLEARLEQWGTFPVGFDRGAASGFMIEPERVELEFTTPSWTPGIMGPARGPAIAYPKTVAEAQALKGRAEGAWIVHRRSEKDIAKKVRPKIDEVLEQAKISGHIYPAQDPRGKLVHTFGRHQISWDDLPTQVQVYVRGDQYSDIVERMDKGTEVALEFSIDNRFFRGPVPLYNVIADIPGTERPDEYVIFGGHLDSWDGAEGAVDNGTGVSTALEAARILMASGAKPKRTIRFMLWSGEEQGLLGSSAYVEQHPELMEKISAVIVHDGGTNYLSGLGVTPEMAEDMKSVFAPAFELNKEMPFGLFYADGMMPGGSDHNSFIAAGVPGFFWYQAGKADYEKSHHTQFDTLEYAIPEYQRHSATIVAIGAWGLANLDHLIDRTDSSPLIRARAAMGIQFDGLEVSAIREDSDPYKMGFRVGDAILQVNGTAVENIYDVARIVFSAGGDDLEFQIKRKGKVQKLVTANANADLKKERDARKARRLARFGELDYKVPFAGRSESGPFSLRSLFGGKKDEDGAKKAGDAPTPNPGAK